MKMTEINSSVGFSVTSESKLLLIKDKNKLVQINNRQILWNASSCAVKCLKHICVKFLRQIHIFNLEDYLTCKLSKYEDNVE